MRQSTNSQYQAEEVDRRSVSKAGILDIPEIVGLVMSYGRWISDFTDLEKRLVQLLVIIHTGYVYILGIEKFPLDLVICINDATWAVL